MGIDGAAAPAEGVIIVEDGGVGGGRGGEEERLVAAQLLGGVGEEVWERPPRCGMWSAGSVNYVGRGIIDKIKDICQKVNH